MFLHRQCHVKSHAWCNCGNSRNLSSGTLTKHMGYIKGTPYPVVNHPKGYLHSESDEVDQLKSNMLSILLTKPGERVCEPFFGTPIPKPDLATPLSMRIQQTRQAIAKSLQRWEPRIQVSDIKVDVHDNSIVGYNVIFISPLDLNKKESLYVTLL